MRGDNYVLNYPSGYTSWANMKGRCDNCNKSNYSKYGGNGLNYPLSWEKFENFLLDMGVRPEGASLDRVDNTKGYSKENCRWATPKEQATNRNNTLYVINPYTGKTYTIAELATKLKVPHQKAYKLYRAGRIKFKNLKPEKEAVND